MVEDNRHKADSNASTDVLWLCGKEKSDKLLDKYNQNVSKNASKERRDSALSIDPMRIQVNINMYIS